MLFSEEINPMLPINVICLAEHWCKTNECVTIDSFDLATRFCRTSKVGGGVCTFVSIGSTYSVFDVSDLAMETLFEVCAIKVTNFPGIMLKAPIIIVTLYGPPRDTIAESDLFLGKLELLLTQLLSTNCTFYILGDFNIHMNQPKCRDNVLLRNLLASFNLTLLIENEITFTGGSGSLIDNCITNNPDCCTKICNSTLTKHRGILVNSYTNSKKGSSPLRRSFGKKNIVNFLSKVNEFNDSEILIKSHIDCSSSTTYLQNVIFSIFDNSFPRVSPKHPKSSLNFGDKTVRDLSDAKWEAWSQFRETGVRKYKTVANKLNKKLKAILNDQKKAKIAKHIAELPPRLRTKKIWEIVNRETKLDESKSIDSIIANDEVIYDPSCIAEAFNNYFAEMGARFSNKDSSDEMLRFLSNIPVVENELTFHTITNYDIAHIASSLNSNAAQGNDKIPGRLITNNIDLFSDSLVFLINDSIKTCTFPDSLKVAKVIPIYKMKGSKKSLNNYRPISVLPFISKFFEKVIYAQLLNFFEANKLFTECQFGFRRNKNTTDALVNFVNNVYSTDQDESIVSIQIDFSKAFDLVDHKLLLKKLKHYGIRGSTHALLKSYLLGRKHFTEIKWGNFVALSRVLECLLGVPQGSLLGPLLFLIFINDLPATLKSLGLDIKVVIYADDTNIIIKGKNILEAIFKVFTVLVEWCRANKIDINFVKTCILNFSPHVLYFDYFKFNDTIINVTSANNYLGLIVDDRLSWHENIFLCNKKLNQQIFALRQLNKIVDQKILLMFYYANFQSKLSYGISVWGESSKVDTLLLTQKRALRAITNKPFNYPCRNLFRRLGIMTVYNLYIYEILMAAIKNGLLKSEDLIPKHTHYTRHVFHNCVSLKSNASPQPVMTSAVNIFNRLSTSLILTFKNEGFVVFRNTLKKKLIEKPFYSLKEFFEDPV